MIVRRFALAIGLFMALVASQLPEYVQQYRQRLGGAVDELKTMIAAFDAEASRLSLSREQGMERLGGNADPLARSRGENMREQVAREARLQAQQDAFAHAGPLSQYLVLFEAPDPRLAEQAYAAYQPAVPVTFAAALSAASGFVAGWGLTHALARVFRRGRRKGAAQEPGLGVV